VTKLVVQNVQMSDAGMLRFFDSLGFGHLVDQYEMTRDI
jgi:hypothetical protein